MKGDTIPPQHHVSHLCHSSKVIDGKIQPSAFILRKYDSGKSWEKSLSVNWLEFLNCSNRNQEITRIQEIYNKKFKKVGTNAKIAVLNVGEMCKKIRTESPDNRKPDVLHDPLPRIDESHSGIYNLKPDELEIARLILETVCESYPARI